MLETSTARHAVCTLGLPIPLSAQFEEYDGVADELEPSTVRARAADVRSSSRSRALAVAALWWLPERGQAQGMSISHGGAG